MGPLRELSEQRSETLPTDQSRFGRESGRGGSARSDRERTRTPRHLFGEFWLLTLTPFSTLIIAIQLASKKKHH